MKDKHNFPIENERLSQAMKLLGENKITSSLNKYRYRYRIARAFEGISAPDVDDRTSGGYAVGIKLFLAYGALNEIVAVRNAIPKLKPAQGEHIKNENSKLAKKIRENFELENLLKTSSAVNNNKLKNDIVNFYTGESNDLMCITTALRNTFAHGIYTASGAGVKTKKRQKELNELTEALLEVTDKIASDCVDEILKRK